MTFTAMAPTYGGAREYGRKPFGRFGLGQIPASEVPGLPVFGPGIVWPEFMAQAREAFIAYATRDTDGKFASVAEYNAVLQQAQDWANGQVASAMISGANIYWRSLETPALHIQVSPTNTAVPDAYKSFDDHNQRFSVWGYDIIRAWEDGNPITWAMLDQGRAEWEAMLAAASEEEIEAAAAAEAAAAEAAAALVAEMAAAADVEVVEATASGVTRAVYISSEGEETDLLTAEDEDWDAIEADRAAAAARAAAEEAAAAAEEAAARAAAEGTAEAAAAAAEAAALADTLADAADAAAVPTAGISPGVVAALAAAVMLFIPTKKSGRTGGGFG